MADPTIGSSGAFPLRQIQAPATSAPASRPAASPEKDFKDYLLASLDKVNRLENEADLGVQKLLTGQTDNVAEVFSATRKAGVDFDLLMEIRNKLMDALSEIKQMRV